MKTEPAPLLSLPDVVAARARLASGLRLTPSLVMPSLREIAGKSIWLKREDLQRTGSFKERGARHALLNLGHREAARGVVAASAGNHALGLAYHGAQLGIRVTVVMPTTAPEVKVLRCRGLGADVVLHGETFEAAQAHAEELARARETRLVHPFDDLDVIAGQGTLALEIVEQVPEFDAVIVPVGGGGLLAGLATVIKSLRPHTRVIAVEPVAAPSLQAARIHGQPTSIPVMRTLADGLAVSRVGRNAFAIAARFIDEVVTVTEDEVGAAVAILARRCGAVVEGAGAAALAAVLSGKVLGRSVVLPVTGRNIDARVHREILAGTPESSAGWSGRLESRRLGTGAKRAGAARAQAARRIAA